MLIHAKVKKFIGVLLLAALLTVLMPTVASAEPQDQSSEVITSVIPDDEVPLVNPSDVGIELTWWHIGVAALAGAVAALIVVFIVSTIRRGKDKKDED